ncbi:MAG: YqhA family protein [Ktedonobacteraceae bacterium]|nr:YqhA family protein [Ktedonobacteraceae bacterium]
MLRRILAGSRYLMVIAVIGSFLASIVVLVYGGLTVISIGLGAFSHGAFNVDGAKHLSVEFIEVIDLLLLGTVLYIIALGLYELFIDETLPTPSWLVITSLDDLKAKLTGVIIVLLAVTFLAEVVNWNGGSSIIYLGVAVGLVLLALGYILNRSVLTDHPKPDHEADIEQAGTHATEE